MNDYKSNIESLMLSYYVKYKRLLPMINTAFSGNPSKEVDVYIDLYDMLKPVYTREVYANKKFIIVSSIMNLVAHYRRYFATRHSVNTNIFLIYGGSTSPSHKTFVKDFGDDQFRETLNYQSTHKFIMDQLKLVKILTGYISHVYYIERTVDFSLEATSNIRIRKDIPSVVITKSAYAMQIPAFNPNAIVIRPKKLADGDNSYFISYNTVLANYFHKISRGSTIQKISELNPELISLIMTITGLQSYNLKSVANSTQAINIIYDAIINNRIINGYNNDIDFVYDNLYGIEKYIDKTNFKFRYNAIDLIYQFRAYMNTPESRDITWMVNFYDPEALKEINDKYFADCPIDLESL